MSIFDGLARVFGYQPISPRADGDQSTAINPQGWFWRFATGGGDNVSGVDVNAETSLQLPVVWDCLRKRSDAVSSIPCVVYRHSQGVAKSEARNVPLYRVLGAQPNDDMDALAFFEFMQLCVDTYGFGVGWKKYNGMGEVVGVDPIHPSMVQLRRTPDPVVGRVVFDITEGGRTRLNTPKEDLFYLPNLTLAADRYTGLSPIAYHKNAIGLGLAAEQFGAAFFGNGARPDGIITFDGKMEPEQKKQKIESWNAQHRTAKKGSKLAVLDQGQKYQAITVPPEHAQFIETRRYTVEDICRIFNVPPALVGGSMGKEDIEQITLNFRVYGMRPMLRRWEYAINRQLLTESQKQVLFAEFFIQELLAADLHAKSNFLTAMLGWGVWNINEVRGEFNMNPIQGGDRHFVPMNMVPLDRLDEMLEKGMQAKNPPTSKKSGDDTASDQKKRQEQNAKMQMAIEDMIRDRGCRLVRIEADQLCAASGREGNFLKWMDRYYDQHAAKMVESLRPMLKVVQLHQERTADDHEVEERVRSYVEDSKQIGRAHV